MPEGRMDSCPWLVRHVEQVLQDALYLTSPPLQPEDDAMNPILPSLESPFKAGVSAQAVAGDAIIITPMPAQPPYMDPVPPPATILREPTCPKAIST